MGMPSQGSRYGQPVEVTNGGHQWGSTNGPTSESHQWGSTNGPTNGSHECGTPVGVYQWISPVGVTSGCHQTGVYQWAYQWGSTLSRCWYALLAVRCLSLQRDAERFRKSSPRLSHYRLLAAPAAVSAPWRPHAPHMRPIVLPTYSPHAPRMFA